MYKSRIRSMQNGSLFRTREVIDLGELYKTRPPALTRGERSHFDFGANNLDSIISRLTPIVRELSKAGFRKPKDVAHMLNKRGVLTACGDKWNPRLAYFLLSFVFEGKVQKQTQLSGAPLKVAGGARLKPKTAPQQNASKSQPQSSSSPLTAVEIAKRLEVLGRIRVSQKVGR